MAHISVCCINVWLPSGFPSPQVTNPKILTFIFQLRSLIFNKKETHVTQKVYKLQDQGTTDRTVVKREWIPSTEFERYPVLVCEYSSKPEHLRNTKPSTSIRTPPLPPPFSLSLSHSCYIPNGKKSIQTRRVKERKKGDVYQQQVSLHPADTQHILLYMHHPVRQ